MKKYTVVWYDHENTIADAPITAETYEEAVAAAWTRHNGKPPATLLMLTEVK